LHLVNKINKMWSISFQDLWGYGVKSITPLKFHHAGVKQRQND